MKINLLSRVLLPIVLFLLPFVAQAQLKNLQDVKDMPPHPRILMLAGEEQQLKTQIAADPVWDKIHQSIINECNTLISTPVLERIVTGRRLLDVSREALRRIFYLSYAYRMTGQANYAERVEKELLAVSTFVDWNPSHFLDVAEMTMAVAIGYDWLYDKLSPASREIIKTAILQKGLDPSLSNRNNGWLRGENNWNQVCNGGMTYGALAIYEEMPEFSKMIIDRAIESIKISMNVYGPDGAYPEGYGYWSYGTSFNAMFLSALEKLWKTDYTLTQIPGFMRTASYLTHMLGVTGSSFNYADVGVGGSMQPTMFWFANKTKDFSTLWDQRKYLESDRRFTHDRLLPAVLIWGSHIRMSDVKEPEQKFWTGGGITPVTMMRTSWTDPNAIYVGFKGGRASSSHAHMDVGSFIMEADGVRWASDFGMQDYNSLEQQGVDLWNMAQNSQRWQVFRYNNYAHSTLTIDNQLHVVNGAANIETSSSDASFMNAIIDLSKVFEGQLASSKRGVAIVDGQYVVVRDEITATSKETTVRWTMMTTAKPKISGKTIQLQKDGKKLTVKVDEPSKVTMKTWTTVSTNDYDAQNPNTYLVGFETKVPAGVSTALTVKLIPQNAKKTGAKTPALSAWPK